MVADVAEHFRLRWQAVTARRRRSAAGVAVGSIDVQLVRTVPERIYPAPACAASSAILESYLRALRSAERLVYLESQFLWSSEVGLRALCEAPRTLRATTSASSCSSPRVRTTAGTTRAARSACSLDADAGGASRFLACTLHQPGRGGSIVYVHAKIAIVDDRWLTIGSANLNEHSFFNDTEVNVVLHDEATVRAARLQLWAEHLERSVDDVSGDPTALIDEVWRPRAEEELERRRRDGYVQHRLTLLPHVSRRAQALWGPISGLLVDG